MKLTARILAAIAVAIFALAAVALAACGDDDDDSGEAEAATQAVVPEGVAAEQQTIETEVSAEGGETTSGPWRIAYIVEPAEPWFVGARFREPAPGETHHIEILPIEAATGRLVPEVPIHLEVLDEGGRVVDEKDLNLYYAEFFHYANNFEIPEDGSYDLRATIDPPTLLRHGEQADGPPLAEGAKVTFEDVELVAET
jgi:hypothetical protein